MTVSSTFPPTLGYKLTLRQKARLLSSTQLMLTREVLTLEEVQDSFDLSEARMRLLQREGIVQTFRWEGRQVVLKSDLFYRLWSLKEEGRIKC